MYELNKATVLIGNFNPRSEKHGDENKLAGDLRIDINCANGALANFHTDLRTMLFRQPALGEQQSLIDGEKLTQLNLPRLKYPLGWDEEFTGYQLTIHTGLGLVKPLHFEDVTLKNFRLTPVEGGTVELVLSAIVHPDEDEAGRLCALIQSKVELSLTPPSKPQAQQDMLAAVEEQLTDPEQKAA